MWLACSREYFFFHINHLFFSECCISFILAVIFNLTRYVLFSMVYYCLCKKGFIAKENKFTLHDPIRPLWYTTEKRTVTVRQYSVSRSLPSLLRTPNHTPSETQHRVPEEWREVPPGKGRTEEVGHMSKMKVKCWRPTATQDIFEQSTIQQDFISPFSVLNSEYEIIHFVKSCRAPICKHNYYRHSFVSLSVLWFYGVHFLFIYYFVCVLYCSFCVCFSMNATFCYFSLG